MCSSSSPDLDPETLWTSTTEETTGERIHRLSYPFPDGAKRVEIRYQTKLDSWAYTKLWEDTAPVSYENKVSAVYAPEGAGDLTASAVLTIPKDWSGRTMLKKEAGGSGISHGAHTIPWTLTVDSHQKQGFATLVLTDTSPTPWAGA